MNNEKKILKFNNYIFEVKDILEFYDRALTFVCEDNIFNDLYLFNEFECSSEYTGWIAVRISIKRYTLIKNNIVSLQKAFFESEQKKYYIFKEYNNKIENEIIDDIKPYEEYFPMEDYYLGDPNYLNSDNYNTNEAAKINETNIVDFIFNINSDYISVNKVSNVFSSFKSICNFKNIDTKNLYFDILPGSKVIRFKLNDEQTLFPSKGIASSFENIIDIFSSNDSNELLKQTNHDYNLLAKINELTKSLMAFKSSEVLIKTAGFDKEKEIQKEKSLPYYKLKDFKKLTEEASERELIEKIIKGHCTAANIKRGTLEFIDPDTDKLEKAQIKKYDGYVFEVPGYYELKVEYLYKKVANSNDNQSNKILEKIIITDYRLIKKSL